MTLAKFIPHNKNGVGKIIINGRDKMLSTLAPEAHIQMGPLYGEDALKDLEKISPPEGLSGNTRA